MKNKIKIDRKLKESASCHVIENVNASTDHKIFIKLCSCWRPVPSQAFPKAPPMSEEEYSGIRPIYEHVSLTNWNHKKNLTQIFEHMKLSNKSFFHYFIVKFHYHYLKLNWRFHNKCYSQKENFILTKISYVPHQNTEKLPRQLDLLTYRTFPFGSFHFFMLYNLMCR